MRNVIDVPYLDHGGSLHRRISDRRNREDLVGCTGQQSFDFVCSTDGFEETRAEKGCGGIACVT